MEMKKAKTLLVAGLVAAAMMPQSALAQGDRVLSQSEINDLLNQARNNGYAVNPSDVDVQYVGGSTVASNSEVCCENIDEQVVQNTEVQETTTFFDAVTSRTIIQPVERTLVQPIERRIVRARTETVTEDTRFEEERLPVRVEQEPVPSTRENVIPQETTETREEVVETFYDAVVSRDIIQPVVRTTVIPVQRRITRPRTETVTNETRFETRTAPARVEADPVPAAAESVEQQVQTVTRDEVTETFVDAVAQRDIIQPVVRTIVQPVEIRRLRPQTETITRDTQFVEERLSVRVETEPAPSPVDNLIPQLSERTVLEVEDVYTDQITRNIIQPVVITTIQPVERRLLRAQSETITRDPIFQEERLAGRVEADPMPATVDNFIPQVTTENREEVTETFFDAVTQRDIIQPIVRTLVQPVEIRRVRGQTETITQETQFETVRASLVVLNVGGPCNCAN